MIDKGILKPGKGKGGSVKRVAFSTKSRITDKRRKAGTDNTSQGEQAEITQKQRSRLAEILFDSIPKDGKTHPNRAVLKKVQKVAKARLRLEVSREMYFEIRNELIDKGSVGKGVGYGGSVYRIEGTVSTAKKSTHRKISERELYNPVRKYIEQTWAAENDIKDFVLDKTAEQGFKENARGMDAAGLIACCDPHVYLHSGEDDRTYHV